MSANDDDRITYLAGEPVDSLTPAERAELDEVRALLEADEIWSEPPPELEDRIVAAISDEARARPDPAPVARSTTHWWSALKPRRPAYAFAAAAAVVVVAVVVAIAANNNSPSQLRFAMVVTGTSLAPGAQGSATLTKTASGWRIELSAPGLPPLRNGRYYQAWLKNAAGILVPVGTFNDANKVTLWSGVPVTQFRTLTVTRQQANGNPKSSGQRVLTGTITASH
ncbi:MAG TPA: anti-sigma factor [Solirubrobacteraceae bacterium]|jgi:hypothetical protein